MGSWDLLGWRTQGLGNLPDPGVEGVGNLDVALDGEFRNWLQWGVDGCDDCGEREVMF